MRSPKEAYIHIHGEMYTVPLFQQRTPSWRVRRSGVVTTTGDSHEMEQEVCYQKFAVEEIFQQFLRTLVPKYEWSMDSIKCDEYMCCSRMKCILVYEYLYIYTYLCKKIACVQSGLLRISSVFTTCKPNRLCRNEVWTKVKSFLILKKTTITAAAATEVGMAYRDIYSKTGYFLLHTITAPQY